VKYLRKIFDFYINANLHVGLAAASLVLISLAEYSDFEIQVNKYAVFVFFSTVFSYNFIRIFDNCHLDLDSFRSRIKQTPAIFLLVAFITLIGLLCFSFQIDIRHLFVLIPAGIITFWYAVPLALLGEKATTLRNYPRVKLFSIALVWGLVSVVFPLQGRMDGWDIFVLFIHRILIIIILVLPFDIRDRDKDSDLMQTLPQNIGVQKTIGVGLLLAVLFVVIAVVKQSANSTIISTDLAAIGLSVFFLVRSKRKQSQYFASFWVEAVPIFWLIVILLN